MSVILDPEKAAYEEVRTRCATYLRKVAEMMERGEVSCAGIVLFDPAAGATLFIPEEVREDAALQIKRFGCSIVGYGKPATAPDHAPANGIAR